MDYFNRPEYRPLNRNERVSEADVASEWIDEILRRVGTSALNLSVSSTRDRTVCSRSWEYDVAPDHPENLSPGRTLVDMVYEKTGTTSQYAIVVNWVATGEAETDAYQKHYVIDECGSDIQMTINEQQTWSSDLNQPARRFIDRPMCNYDIDELHSLLYDLDHIDKQATTTRE